MASYPSENSLVVNATHQLLDRIRGPYNQTIAIALTRYQEHQAGGGYDVELPLAMRFLFQYKATKAKPNRGVRFKLDTQQITTLATREPSEVAYYASIASVIKGIPRLTHHEHFVGRQSRHQPSDLGEHSHLVPRYAQRIRVR